MVYLLLLLPILGAVGQSSVLPALPVLDLKVELVLLLVVAWSMLRGVPQGLLWALVGGLCLDLLSAVPFGTITTAMAAVSVLASMEMGGEQQGRVLVSAGAAAMATIAFDLLVMFLLEMQGWPVYWLDTAIYVVMPSVVLNALAMVIVFWAVRWLHRKIPPKVAR